MARLPFPGLVGWGAFFEDRPMTHRSYADWLGTARIEQVLSRLIKFVENRKMMEPKPARLVWTFENLLLHVACRDDGACLLLVVENTPQAPSVTLLSVVDEFLQAPP